MANAACEVDGSVSDALWAFRTDPAAAPFRWMIVQLVPPRPTVMVVASGRRWDKRCVGCGVCSACSDFACAGDIMLCVYARAVCVCVVCVCVCVCVSRTCVANPNVTLSASYNLL